MASLAGNGLPRTRTNTAGSQGARLRADVAFAAVLALLSCAIVGGGVAFFPHTRDISRQRAEEAILPGSQIVAETAADMEHAEKLDDLAKAGAVAHSALGNLELIDGQGISDSKFRSAAEDVWRAQIALLSALEPLADLDESTVGKWRSERHGIRAAVRQLDRTRPTVAELGLTTELNVWGPVLTWSLANADAVVAEASHRLGKWHARVEALRQERREGLAAIASYESSVRGDVASFDRLRADLDQWIRDLDAEGTTAAKARKFLRSAAAARQRIRNRIAALDAPATLVSAHTKLLAFFDRTIAALGSARATKAYSAVREPSGALSTWQTAVTAEAERLRAIELPKRPNV